MNKTQALEHARKLRKAEDNPEVHYYVHRDDLENEWHVWMYEKNAKGRVVVSEQVI